MELMNTFWLLLLCLFEFICDAKNGHKPHITNRRKKLFLRSDFKFKDTHNINTYIDYSSIERSIKQINLKNCGLKRANNYISGGEEAVPNEFPFIVSLQEQETGAHQCGGSIINKWWIITAAHCIEGLVDYSALRIMIGAHNNQFGQQYNISRIITHKKYDDITVLADIALIRVDRKIKFSSNVNSICLPTKQYYDHSGVMTVAGWGKDEEDSYTDVLRKADISIISDELCAKMNEKGYFSMNVYRSHICTFERGKDTCSGDSGGPAFQYINGRAVLIGIVSFGIGCADEYPAVYTQVTYFLDWIASHINYKPLISPRG